MPHLISRPQHEADQNFPPSQQIIRRYTPVTALVSVLALGLLMSGNVQAKAASTVEVNSLNDVLATDGKCTLREALSLLNLGEHTPDNLDCLDTNIPDETNVITFKPTLRGTIKLSGSGLFISEPVNIIGPGADKLTIDGDNKFRIFEIAEGAATGIAGLTLTKGHTTEFGGAIRSVSDLSIISSTISGNSASRDGGGLYVAGTLSVSNSTISGNSTDNTGGGVAAFGPLSVSHSTISGNSAPFGGGGLYNSRTLTLSNSTVSNNKGGRYGDDLFLQSGSQATIINSTFFYTTETGKGVSIYLDAGSTMTLKNSLIAIDGTQTASCTGPGTITATNSLVMGDLRQHRHPRTDTGEPQARPTG